MSLPLVHPAILVVRFSSQNTKRLTMTSILSGNVGYPSSIPRPVARSNSGRAGRNESVPDGDVNLALKAPEADAQHSTSKTHASLPPSQIPQLKSVEASIARQPVKRVRRKPVPALLDFGYQPETPQSSECHSVSTTEMRS